MLWASGSPAAETHPASRRFRVRHQSAPEVVRAKPEASPGRMLFSLREVVQWLGFAPLELLLQGLALLAASVLVVLKVEGGPGGAGGAPGLSWWGVFGPFFAADGLSTYFTAIVSVRLFQDGEKRLAVLRLFWILTLLSLKFVFEMLLCQKLGGHQQSQELWYGLIMAPVFILLQLLMIRACRVN